MTENIRPFDNELLPHYLNGYYKSLFPFESYIKWLSYSKDPKESFGHREFVFILKDGIHIRYKCYDNPEEFTKELRSTAPEKLDLGPVYNHRPKFHKTVVNFAPVEREFVMDIDMTDYDDVRTCCKDANVCNKCWKFIVVAIEVLDHTMRSTFGFGKLLWVFSGRRGVHCWVADEKARKLSNSARSAIISFLGINSKENLKTIHTAGNKDPFTEEAFRKMLESPTFNKMVFEQGWLEDEAKFLKDNFNPTTAQKLKAGFAVLKTAQSKWSMLKDYYFGNETSPYILTVIGGLRKFVIKTAFPRLDERVSVSMNHLLKSPFCIHPKTGNVAVPIDVHNLAGMKVEDFPRIDDLLRELQVAKSDGNATKYNSSLQPYISLFDKFVSNL
uniref:DNA primase n=1 Tax=Rhabditophanes sp. KR3021 TaxID=114890 RepID=A0AC35UCZ5_9BILA